MEDTKNGVFCPLWCLLRGRLVQRVLPKHSITLGIAVVLRGFSGNILRLGRFQPNVGPINLFAIALKYFQAPCNGMTGFIIFCAIDKVPKILQEPNRISKKLMVRCFLTHFKKSFKCFSVPCIFVIEGT